MRILVTGAGGQLGRSLQRELQGHTLAGLKHGALDVTDPVAVREALDAFEPALVVNAAAWNKVDEAETSPEAAFAVNETGARILAEATAERGIPLVQVSTDYVFDGRAREPYDEDARPNPLSAYGRSKLAGEEAVRASNPRHMVVRTAWLFHERGKNFPLTMIELAKRGPVRVVEDQRGSPTYAPHLARAIGRLIEAGDFGTWHLAGSGVASWYELTQELFARLRIRTPILPVPTAEFRSPARRPRYSALATRREPRILLPPWQEGLDAFVAALRARR